MILRNYIHIQPQYFSPDDLAQISACANNHELMDAKVGAPTGDDADGKIENEIRSSQVKWILPHEFPKEFQDKLHAGIMRAHEECGWTWDIFYQQAIQYTVYKYNGDSSDGFYTWHTDASPELYNENGQWLQRKTSWVIQLSNPEDYEGGDFQYINPTTVFDRLPQHHIGNIDITDAINTVPFSGKEQGSLLVFPSFVHHQVQKITRGERRSLVGWACGENYI